VFIDFLSFERQQPTGTWIAYGQFVRHFLLPLLLYRKLAMTPSEIFLIHRDGISPERARQLLRGLDLMSAMALELVVLPNMLSRRGSRMLAAQHRSTPIAFDASVGLPLFLRTLHRLQRMVERLRPDYSKSKSLWGGYEETRAHYSDADLEAKTAFVRQHLGGSRKVLDLGCNAGEFSLLAAESGATVVSADADDIALSRLYGRIRGKYSRITPIFLNIGRPTPSIGWENRETESFLSRSVGQFDCILVLGLIHHLLVSERSTLPMVVNLLARLEPQQVILEWVDPTDPKFRQVAGLNAALYKNLNSGVLEDCMVKKYTMREKLPLPCGTRVMYLWGRQ
jgi:SAM-dependent methyltransferase